jgi:hypothetical protein
MFTVYMTNLRAFHTTLEQIKSEEQKITDLNNCYTINQDSFDIDTTECVLSDGSTVPYNTLYGELLQTAYGSNNYNSFIKDLEDINGGIQRTLDDNTIKDKHANIKKVRNKLDNQMNELYDLKEDDVYRNHTSTVYMSLTWTVLATSVLYYLFIKL